MVLWMFLSGLAILVAWTIVDVLMHRLLLRPVYEQSSSLWRPFDQMNVALIYVATFSLIGAFVVTYGLLINPKSLGAGVGFGALLGLALGVASGLGTYIHMPIPRALAWSWFFGGWLKGVVAGAILGLLITQA
ncbi:MAG TPA: hypothetical protein VFS21_22760 [Roseiflexaceae bacterium]|nr:hypothetical protein [Roseiflexaceae bacterium]